MCLSFGCDHHPIALFDALSQYQFMYTPFGLGAILAYLGFLRAFPVCTIVKEKHIIINGIAHLPLYVILECGCGYRDGFHVVLVFYCVVDVLKWCVANVFGNWRPCRSND